MSDLDNTSDTWPPADCPALAWPALPDPQARLAWYQAVIKAYAALWEGHVSAPMLTPVAEGAIQALEQQLGCALPAPLRQYHLQLGALSLAETLCSVQHGPVCIQPLLAAYPGITDIYEDNLDLPLVEALVAFGDYLGNGNMFCFHRQDGAVYYFDHDTEPALTRFFDSTQDYLDALMLRCLAEVHDDDDAGEALLGARYGESLVRKWLY